MNIARSELNVLYTPCCLNEQQHPGDTGAVEAIMWSLKKEYI